MRCRQGFTLAEVLITLAIIGVVAALTIPTLVSTYKKKVIESRLSKFYSTMNQAIKLSEIENGPIVQWDKLNAGYETDEDDNKDYSKPYSIFWFNKYLKPYIKIAKIEKEPGSLSGFIKVYLNDGSLFTFSASNIAFYPFANDYDTTLIGSEDNPTVRDETIYTGIKHFNFLLSPWKNSESNKYHYQKGVEPYMYGWDGTKEKLLNDSAIGCKKEVTNERAYCTVLIKLNGWKIPDDYPLKF